jgi:hypothetical protein
MTVLLGGSFVFFGSIRKMRYSVIASYKEQIVG